MTIHAFAGFEDQPVGTTWGINAATPIPTMRDKDGVPVSLNCSLGGNVNSWTHVATQDPDGVGCTGVCLLSSTASVGTPQHATFGPPIEFVISQNRNLDRTGTWHWGCSVFTYTGSMQNGTALAIIGDTGNLNATRPIYGYNMTAATYPNVANVVNGVAAYVEFSIDWVKKTVRGYVNGVECESLAFTGDPICQIGNLAKTGYMIGNQTYNVNLNTPGSMPQFSHFYFVVNKAGDPNPTPRLGSCRVRTVPLKTALAGDAKVVGALDANGVINQKRIALNATNWTNYIQLPSGDIKMVVKPVGVTVAKTDKVLAAQWSVVNYKPLDQAAGQTLSVGDGTNTVVDLETQGNQPGVTLIRAMPQAPDGGSWSQEKLNSFQVTLGSYNL